MTAEAESNVQILARAGVVAEPRKYWTVAGRMGKVFLGLIFGVGLVTGGFWLVDNKPSLEKTPVVVQDLRLVEIENKIWETNETVFPIISSFEIFSARKTLAELEDLELYYVQDLREKLVFELGKLVLALDEYDSEMEDYNRGVGAYPLMDELYALHDEIDDAFEEWQTALLAEKEDVAGEDTGF